MGIILMADNHITPADLRRVVLFAAFVYLSIRFIDAIAGIILIFGIILLATLILNPIVTWLERHKAPRAFSSFVLALLALAAIVLTVWLVIPPLVTQFWDLASNVPNYLTRLRDWLGREFPGLARQTPTSTDVIIEQAIERIVPVLGGLTGYALSFVNLLASVFIILISTIFALSNPRPVVQGFLAMFPTDQRQRIVDTVQEISIQMRAWALGTIINMLIIFVLTWVALALIGIDGAFLFAVIAGVLEVVPYVGPIVAGALPTLVALGQDPMLAVWVVIAFVVIQQAESQLVIPLVMSGQLQQHPLSIIFFVLVMGGLFGLIGIFLAVPAAAVVKVLLNRFYLEPRTIGEGHEISKGAEQVVSGRSREAPEENQPDG